MRYNLLLVGLTILVVCDSSYLRNVLVEYRYPNEEGVVLGIDSRYPKISWSLAPQKTPLYQESYRVVVSSNEVVWDTGRVTSNQLLNVVYSGKTLDSDTRYNVYVHVWTTNNEVHTNMVQFHTGLYNEGEFEGKWISSTTIFMNQLRKEFSIPSYFLEATAFISGIGYYELYFNGQNVDPSRKLDPGWTTYETRVLYATFNVTSLLQTGPNAVGVLLGNGWYSQDQNIWPSKQRPSYGPPRLIFQLNVKLVNGNVFSVVSDETWTGRESAIIMDSIYHGEIVDGRKEREGWSKVGFIDTISTWINAEVLPAPGGVLSAQMMEPIRTDVEIKPISMHSPCLNTYIIDFGQNFAGWARVKLRGPRGVHVSLRYAEIIEPPQLLSIYDGMIYVDNLRAAAQTDEYIYRGDPKGEIYEPRFTVHGFRYLEITNAWESLHLENITGVVVHSYAPNSGSFVSDNHVINQIQHAILWGQRSNLMSLPTDCPQRDERKGWMGDAALTVDEALFNFQLGAFYQNWAQNIRDTQTADGAVPDTVPLTFGESPADPNWGTAYPTTVYAMYDHFGDLTFVNDHYPNVKAWIDLLTEMVNKSGIAHMFYHYGDWVPPPPAQRTNESLTSAATYALDVMKLSKLAGALNLMEDMMKYQALYKEIVSNFHNAFYNVSSMKYADGSQTATVLALTIGAVPPALQPAIVKSLIDDITLHNNHLTTGIIGTRHLFELLTNLNYHDVALKIVNQTTYPSYGYMFNNPYENATTLWELWDAPFQGPGMNSRNHIMFGSIGAWFYRYVAGIKPNSLKRIEISPAPVGFNSPINNVEATYDSMLGKVIVNWCKRSESFEMDVALPPGSTGRIVIPRHERSYTNIILDGIPLLDDSFSGIATINNYGVETIRILGDGSYELLVQSGFYQLLAKI